MSHTAIDGYAVYDFVHNGLSHPLYVGGEGPAVVVIHEVPGITPQVVYFADRLREAGYTVYMPSLFGTPGQAMGAVNVASAFAVACVRREFRLLAAKKSSPVTEFLKAVCRRAHAECGGRGVGALGMCLTGNFALSLMLDDSVMAPVLSQPSLPVGRAGGVHLSDPDMERVRQRCDEFDTRVIGLRFTGDALCRKPRFDDLEEKLGNRFERIEIDSKPGNEHGIHRFAHSVLTNDLVDAEGHPTRAALDRVLEHFEQQLK
ncbi:dienelactone hydrolase family protein [gamma proteobacterium HTCC5015]|nr:dienelactone hydrolase family protein [gamma proteobacterium HTCC5015]